MRLALSSVTCRSTLSYPPTGVVASRVYPPPSFRCPTVDDRMFVKLDVLGLRTLDMIGYWDELVAERDLVVEWSGLDQ